MAFADLAEALTWLDAHVDFESTVPDNKRLPSLERMRALMVLLADPERAVPAIHITGTNGKGSTATMATSLLMSLGLSVGTYTSPNLERVNERIARNAQAISDDELREVLWSLALLEPLLPKPASRFELLTAAALSWFASEAVDVAVVEVGLGGTWDATNVLDAPVCVITNVSYDHTDVLGPTLEHIATDKSGIAKAASTVVIGESNLRIASLIDDVVRANGATQVWKRGAEFSCEENDLALGGRLVSLRTPTRTYREILVPLHGAHQGDNAAVALAAVEALVGQSLSDDVVAEGFASTRIPGRLEVVARHPLVVLDGAHNPAGMEVLARALRDEFSVDGAKVALVGMLRARDPRLMLAPLLEAGVREVVLTRPDSPRAMEVELLEEVASSLGYSTEVETDIAAALRRAKALAGETGLVVVTGSLYLVGSARTLCLGPPS